MHYNLVTILGPTASGKTKLAAQLASEFNGEIISADSRQVYRGMDIGTGKDLNDYFVHKVEIPHYLIDILEPSEEFNLFLFRKKFVDAFKIIIDKKKFPFLVGGTGLYLSSIIQNYKMKPVEFSKEKIDELNKLDSAELRTMLKKLNPELHNKTDLKIKERIIRAIVIAESVNEYEQLPIKINSLNIGIKLPAKEVKKKITDRLKFRLNNGMIEEVQRLIYSGLNYDKLNFFGLEYKYVGSYLKGDLNYNDMFQKLNSAIHNFAKRQMTWFRKMEKEGVEINWIDGPDIEKAKKLIKKL
jgi:tRNA dimethylallyltransferase